MHVYSRWTAVLGLKKQKMKMSNIFEISEIRRPGRPAALFLALSIFCLPACSDRIGPPDTPGQDLMRISLAPAGVEETSSPGMAMEGEDAINDVKIFRFEEGILRETISPSRDGTSGIYSFRVKERSGELRILANSSGIGHLDDLIPDTTALDEFLAMEATAGQMQSDGILMSGDIRLSGSAGPDLKTDLVRSLARLDVKSVLAGVEVLEVSIDGFSEAGRIHSPVQAQGADGTFIKDFSSSPLRNARERLMYLVAQSNSKITVGITASYGGGLHRMEVQLPSDIRRNNVYTVNVHGNGAGVSASVSEGDWESAREAVSQPSKGGLVDVENSVIPPGVRVSDGRDTVYVPYLQNEFVLALMAEAGSSVAAAGNVEGVEITFSPSSKASLERVTDVKVSVRHRVPGSLSERIYLNVTDGTADKGRVVLMFEANPIKVTGKMKFDLDGVCDFGTYTDGELARIVLPAGKRMWIGIGDGESPWLISEQLDGAALQSAAGMSYRIVAGWKPNDPLADGREQQATIYISDDDGGNQEEYVVKRRNWGLPVVQMGDTWWCMFNLRGNVKSFGDQITCGEEPVGQDGLMAYLSSASEDELLALMGDQYQGGNPQGLPLRYDGSAFYHEGMMSNAQNFGTIDPSLMAPDGYMIPDYEDYLFFSANNNFNLGGIGERPFNNKTGQRLKISISERETDFLGGNYGNVSFYDFEYNGNHWVLFGLGHQWNTVAGNIAKKNLLLATYGDSANTWAMEGYSAAEKPGENWMKFAANNSTKTRMIRCIKTPVEYIYD